MAAICVKKFRSLLIRNGYIFEDVQKHGNEIKKLVKYGTPSTLLRRNIQSEWWENVVVQNENAFPVENSCIFESQNLETNNNRLKIIDSQTPEKQLYLCRSVSDDLLEHYLPTLRILDCHLPFSLVSTGKYYDSHSTIKHNQSNDHLLQLSIEKTSLVLQHFISSSNMFQSVDKWMVERVRWWKKYFRLPGNVVTNDTKSDSDELLTRDICYKCPWGNEVIESIRNLGDQPLIDLELRTGQNCKGKWKKKSALPHILQLETSLENSMTAFLLDSYDEREIFSTAKSDEKQEKCLLLLHSHLAPYKVAVATPINRTRQVSLIADHFMTELRKTGVMVFNTLHIENSTQGAQFQQYDELGIPYTIVLNEQTVEKGIVGLRDRNTSTKEQLHMTNVIEKLLSYIKPL
ncbi:hypothetical protein LOTGIDRAFT_228927 [Lottia gigantea]|uniref:Anticodon-binding domain-containing protein n=1 Tax=Lottia gigantea TaxID=225164 RepID=V4BK80_LOTGI|nr:hypothetical protein LOTGIDRAFT_228927 [Lottia gigantea]ESO88979.1 hypothetical protein LOTGIDRAFT_228927 [Lottia gigantea]